MLNYEPFPRLVALTAWGVDQCDIITGYLCNQKKKEVIVNECEKDSSIISNFLFSLTMVDQFSD